MLDWYIHYSLLTTIALVVVFAWMKGATPERLGATANLVAALSVFVVQRLLQKPSLELSLLAIDGILGLFLMALAVRFASLWLGAAMLLQATQFSLHGFYFVTMRSMDRTFFIVNNSVSWGLLLCIIAGTLGTWLVSRRAQNSR